MPHLQVGISAGASGLQRTEGTTLFQASTQQVSEDWVSPKRRFTHIVNTFQHNMHMQSKKCLGVLVRERLQEWLQGFHGSLCAMCTIDLLFVICRILECFRLPSGKSTVYQDHPRSSKIEVLLCQQTFV